eukprot:jgi/Ulvmu1/707/UM010_0079.1
MNSDLAQSQNSCAGTPPGGESPEQDDGIQNAFRHISGTQVDQFREMMPANDDAAMDVVSAALALGNPQTDTRQHLCLNLSVRTMQFAMERKFSNTKAGVMFNILQTLLHSMQQGESRQSCELLVQNCLIPLAKAHPPPDTPYFTALDLKAMTEFFADHVIQFLTLFSYVFLQERDQETAVVENVVEIPYAPALETAFAEDVWNDMVQQKATEERQVREAAEAQAQAEAEAAELSRLEKEKADAHFKRKQELAIKPERLDEAVEKLIKWRIESEKQKLRDQYTQEVATLRGELEGLIAQEGKGGKAGKGK